MKPLASDGDSTNKVIPDFTSPPPPLQATRTTPAKSNMRGNDSLKMIFHCSLPVDGSVECINF